jgi:hypothetical protein
MDMRETKEFDAFGVKYRTREFAAAYGFKNMEKRLQLSPMELLRDTEVLLNDGAWVRLDSPQSIDLYVRDVIGFFAPHLVLEAVMGAVRKESWGFLSEWKMVKIPRRFQSTAESVSLPHIDPMMSRIQAEKLATQRELEEYYSLHDAFNMYDAIALNSLNSLVQQEAAQREAERKAKSKAR